MCQTDTSINVELSLVGDCFDTELISKELLIQPSEVLKKGELLQGRRKPNIETSWSFETGFEKSLDINNQLVKITDLFMSKEHLIKDICSRLELNVFISITIRVQNQEFPSIHIENKILSFFSGINADMDIDVYLND